VASPIVQFLGTKIVTASRGFVMVAAQSGTPARAVVAAVNAHPVVANSGIQATKAAVVASSKGQSVFQVAVKAVAKATK